MGVIDQKKNIIIICYTSPRKLRLSCIGKMLKAKIIRMMKLRACHTVAVTQLTSSFHLLYQTDHSSPPVATVAGTDVFTGTVRTHPLGASRHGVATASDHRLL